MGMYTSQGRYWLTQDGSRVVPEGDPEAATLYATAGREVDADEADRLGMMDLERAARKRGSGGAAAAAPEPDPAHVAPTTVAAGDLVGGEKAVEAASVEDKAVDGPKAAGKGR